jgi:hypothetical protein
MHPAASICQPTHADPCRHTPLLSPISDTLSPCHAGINASTSLPSRECWMPTLGGFFLLCNSLPWPSNASFLVQATRRQNDKATWIKKVSTAESHIASPSLTSAKCPHTPVRFQLNILYIANYCNTQPAWPIAIHASCCLTLSAHPYRHTPLLSRISDILSPCPAGMVLHLDLTWIQLRTAAAPACSLSTATALRLEVSMLGSTLTYGALKQMLHQPFCNQDSGQSPTAFIVTSMQSNSVIIMDHTYSGNWSAC